MDQMRKCQYCETIAVNTCNQCGSPICGKHTSKREICVKCEQGKI